MNFVYWYFVIGLTYTIIEWIVHKKGLVELMEKPLYRNMEIPVMLVAVIIIVIIWPGMIITKLFKAIRKGENDG